LQTKTVHRQQPTPHTEKLHFTEDKLVDNGNRIEAL